MKFTMPIVNYRNMFLPEIDKKDLKHGYGYAPISATPPHLKEHIVQSYTEDGPTKEQIEDWLMSKPDVFYHYAPPVVLHASSLVFDNRKGKMSFELADPEKDGIILNGLTLSVVLDNIKPYSANTPDGEIYLEVEFLSGLDRSEIEQLCKARQSLSS